MYVTFTRGPEPINQEAVHDRPQCRWTLYSDNHRPLSKASEGYNNLADAVGCFNLNSGTLLEVGHPSCTRFVLATLADRQVMYEQTITVKWPGDEDE